MTTTESKVPSRQLTSQELADFIRLFREMRKWSQETLAAVSGLNVRTVQRAENGEPSSFDTRRALARAFGFHDLDAFNKTYSIPTDEDLKKVSEEFKREHLLLDTSIATTGRELAVLFETSTADTSIPAIELNREQATEFAGLLDYLRDYRDCADHYTEVQKLDVHEDLHRYIDALDRTGISVCYASRKTELVGRDWEDKTPWPVTLVYLSAFHKGRVPSKMAVPRKVRMA